MSKGREVRAFDYVNQPYETVRDKIRNDGAAIFRRATKVAEDRNEAVIASLSVNVGGIEISKDVSIRVGDAEEHDDGHSKLSRVMHIPIEWEAADSPRLFPAMKGKLAVYPLSFTETQVELDGHYQAPMGALGNAVDALVLHRLAEASIHRFVQAVVEHLRR